jgi:hypothetical protein
LHGFAGCDHAVGVTGSSPDSLSAASQTNEPADPALAAERIVEPIS